MKRIIQFTLTALPLGLATLHAGEIGHFAPGVLNIRDFAMPAPGFYGAVYTYGYSTDRLNDADGNGIDSVNIRPGPGPGVTLGVDVDVDVYAIAPTFIYVSNCEIFGAKYGLLVTPSFGNTSVGASLSSETGSGRSVNESQFGLGDLYIQPLWLGWGKPNWDFSLSYGFYAPVGKYDTETVTLPVIGPITAEAADNIGYGFWTQQVQGGVTWYPWEHKRMAVSTALTYEYHCEKEDFDFTPGQTLTMNWGVSQFIPVNKDQTLLLEIGPAGYSSWQISDDAGSDAAASPVKDSVHAAGAQIGLTYIPWNAALIFRYFHEFASEDRFMGDSIGLNFGMKF